MSVTTQQTKIRFISQGDNRYIIPFPFGDAKEIKVFSLDESTLKEEELIQNEDYGVILPSDIDGSIKVTEEGLKKTPKGNVITIMRRPPLTQETTLAENDPFYTSTIENMVDKLTYIAIMLKEDIERSIKYPIGLSSKPGYSELSELISKAYEAVKNSEEVIIRTEQAATKVEESALDVAASKDTAMKWAVNPENVPVEEGKYSAYHYAMQIKNSNDYATIDEAVAGESATKVMTPLASKSAIAGFSSIAFQKRSRKTWGEAQKAEKNGVILCECVYGKETTGAPFTLEISDNEAMDLAFSVVNADCYSASIIQSFIFPISKGDYFKASGGLASQKIFFMPLKGDL